MPKEYRKNTVLCISIDFVWSVQLVAVEPFGNVEMAKSNGIEYRIGRLRTPGHAPGIVPLPKHLRPAEVTALNIV